MDEKEVLKTQVSQYTASGQCSPSLEARILEHKIEIDDLERKELWGSCLTEKRTDSRLLRFLGKFVFSCVTLIFCFYGLGKSNDCSPLIPFYTSLIGGIVGAWVNLPQEVKK